MLQKVGGFLLRDRGQVKSLVRARRKPAGGRGGGSKKEKTRRYRKASNPL